MDCSSASDADRVCECGEGDQWPKDRNPMFFMPATTTTAAETSREGLGRVRRRYSVEPSPVRGAQASAQVEPVQHHDLVPGRDEVTHELLPRVVLGVDLGDRPQ